MTVNKTSKCDVYPFMITNATHNEMMHGCESGSFMSGNKDGNTGCSSCCWMCFPCSLTLDILCAIPFGLIWSINKCTHKNTKTNTTITIKY